MARKSVFVSVFLAAGLALGAQDLLVRLTVPPGEAAAGSLRSRVRLLSELEDGGLALLDAREMEALRARGTQVLALDQAPEEWDYWLVMLRPDSDLADLRAAGDVLHTEESWVLLRTPPGHRPARLQEGQFFVTPLPREPMAASSPEEDVSLLARRPAGPEHALPLVQKIVAGVSTSNIDDVWSTLSPPNGTPAPTRYTSDAGCGDDSVTCYTLMSGYGLPVAYDDYGGTSRAPSVIATHPGAVTPTRVYIVEGHLDDMPSSGYAPGADDNASGTVVVLEAARTLSCYAFKSTIKFLAVTGEETGLEGSAAYAAGAAARGEDIRGVINLDMVGWAGDGVPAGENLDLNYNANSQALGLFYAQCATDYATGLAVDAFLCPNLTASDHFPFWQRGYRAVCAITDNEGSCGHGGHYPYYHTSGDTLANCGDRSFFYAVNRTTVAALAELAEPFKILFDREAYTCGDTAGILLGDRDLNTDPTTAQTAAVAVRSGAEPLPEVVLLTEESADSMLFRGPLAFTSGPPVHGDGFLSVGPQDTLVATYIDAQDCDGAADVPYDASAAFTSLLFPGLSSVANPAGAACALALSWPAAVPSCGGEYTYSVYRSTDPGFSPSPADRVASGLTGTAYVDTSGLLSGTPYHYIVRAADAAGVEETNLTVRTGIPTGPVLEVTWSAGAEAGDPELTLTGGWSVSPTYSRTGGSGYASGYPDSACTVAVTPPLTLGTSPVLSYYGLWSTERNRDGGQVQISRDGGTTWSTLTPAPSYPTALLSATNACALPAGTRVYSGNSVGYPDAWQLATVELPASDEGQTVLFRWRFSTDADGTGSGPNPGWYLDDIQVSPVRVNTACETLVVPGETAPGDQLSTAETWSDKTTHTWPANPQATGYKVLRGTPDQLPDLLTAAADHCVKWTGTGTSAPLGETPTEGSFYWYLVVGTNGAGDGDAGSATAGTRIIDSTGICP